MSFRLTVFGLVVAAVLPGTAALAGPVSEQFRGGAFGVAWTANAATVEARYPNGTWSTDENGRKRYCAASRQPLLKLPPQHQTRELCFLIGDDRTVTSVTARLDATLPSLLAVVNRSRTLFGDFDAVRRDEAAIQSRYTYMLWTKDRPFVLQVGSANDADGRPVEVTLTVSDDGTLNTRGADAVSNRPVASNTNR
jgi:hypothetical protein